MSLIRRLLSLGEPTSRVSMRMSVGEHAAGEKYDIPVTLADQWIARGYCDGNLSQPYTDDELAALRGNNITVVI